jgi:MFS transporter, MHS family, shikimate and dehydroshikimate transport protein
VRAPILLLALRVLLGPRHWRRGGGAVLMAIEYAPKERRGFYGSYPQIGVPAGLFLATIIVYVLSLASDEVVLARGWRGAFLLSALLVAVGLYIRLRILETPMFERLKKTQEEAVVLRAAAHPYAEDSRHGLPL